MLLLEMRLQRAQESLARLEAEGVNDYLAASLREEIAKIEGIISSERELDALLDSEAVWLG